MNGDTLSVQVYRVQGLGLPGSEPTVLQGQGLQVNHGKPQCAGFCVLGSSSS